MPDEGANAAITPNGDASGTNTVEPKPQTGEELKESIMKLAAPPPQKRRAPDAELLKTIIDRQDELLKSLSAPSRTRRLRLKVRDYDHPELLKVYGVIYNRLDELQRLLTERATAPPEGFEFIEQQLRSLLARSNERSRTGNVHAAWEFAGSLELMLLTLGDDNYIITRLDNEQEREQKKLPGSWSDFLAIEKLNELLEKYKPGDTSGLRDRAIEYLALLYTRRTGFERSRRTREELKADYLNRLTIILTVLLFLLVESIYFASTPGAGRFSQSFWSIARMIFTLDLKLDLSQPDVRYALVAAVIGALGSTLSGFYKLRDETGGIATLRAFRSAMWAQPFVGATAGVLLMLLIKSGVLALGATSGGQITSWWTLSIYCFLAGFSEPFFLGVVQRVASAADKTKSQGGNVNDAADKTNAAGGSTAAGNK